MSDWYVIANQQYGSTVHLRVVAGPLTKDEATEEAQLRAHRTAGKFNLEVVEFDPFFGLTQT